MANEDEESRTIGVCVECGSMYAALELPNGTVQPIGSRKGCTSCGATEFAPLSGVSDGADSVEVNDTD